MAEANSINADKARVLAEELVAAQPSGFHTRLADDPSFERWLVSDITKAIINAYFKGREDQVDSQNPGT